MKRIRTVHELPFSPLEVWSVLTDFERYSEWNPLNIWAQGEARRGGRVRMKIVDAGSTSARLLSQAVTLTVVEPPHRLEWVGRIPLLFRGRHFFELTDCAGGTRLLQGEDLSGVIPAFFSDDRLKRQAAAYDATNAALEDRLRELAAQRPS